MFKNKAKTNFNPFYGIFMLLLGSLCVSTNSKECFILDISSSYNLHVVGYDYPNSIEIYEKFEIDTTNNITKEHKASFSWNVKGWHQYLYSLSFNYIINDDKLHLSSIDITMVYWWYTKYMPFRITKQTTVDFSKINEYNGINTPFNKIESYKLLQTYLTINSYFIKLSPCTIKSTTVTRIVPTSSTAPIETRTKEPETKSETTNETNTESITKNDQIKHENDNPSSTALKLILISVVITGILLIPIILFSLKKYKQHRVVTSEANTSQDA